MTNLNDFGRLALATAIFYIPIFITAIIIVFRHGFRKDLGWVFLVIFSTARILGGVMLTAAQLVTPINTTLYEVAYICESAGLSPLLLATLGFLRTILDRESRYERVWKLLGLVGTIGLIMSIVGGTGTSSDPSKQHTANTERRVGVILFLVLYLLLVGIHVMAWMKSSSLMKHRRTLLIGISSALPFLGVRLLYSILSAFSGNSFLSATPNTGALAKFSIVSGSPWLYLGMSLIMEYVVAVVYTVVGAKTPLQNDYHPNAMGSPSEDYPMKPETGYFPQSQAQQAYAGAHLPSANTPQTHNVYAPQSYNGYTA